MTTFILVCLMLIPLLWIMTKVLNMFNKDLTKINNALDSANTKMGGFAEKMEAKERQLREKKTSKRLTKD